MVEDPQDRPNVIALPPLIYLGFILLGVALDYLWPTTVIAYPLHYPLGGALLIVGMIIIGLALQQFHRAGTHVEPYKPTTVLITNSVFSWSRNPIYMAFSLIHIGIAMAADNLWILLLLIPTLVVVRFGVIAREEDYLDRKFGDAYRRYQVSVRRWI